jgi:3'-phosphoadenosine 5'-phosphosulfate sulfotransferase (PAPS reductase)/FAD synthetase
MDKKILHIASCSFGKDSIATILLALENNEIIDRAVFAEVMFDHKRNITGEIPENIQWIKEVAIPKLESMGVRVDLVKAKDDYVSVCSRKFKTPKPNGIVYYGVQNSRPCYANTYLKLEPIKQYYKKIGKEYDIIQYIGIASDEPQRLKRLEGTNKVSLLANYGYTEAMAMAKCKEYDLVSPLYSMGCRGGCWFCFNANLERYIHIRKNYPEYWQALMDLYYETDSRWFKYSKTLTEVEKEMDLYELNENIQLKLF